ncbi:MAG: hypothetical protein WBB07_26655 [Mycobacterium sp.]
MLTGREPDGVDEDQQGLYWVQINSGRWQQAVEIERNSQMVLCDSDPVTLHYSWSLARVGAAPWSRFMHELRYVREAVAAERLGFSDAVLVSIPPIELLRKRKEGDVTRQRRSFELHVRLAEPLREWYDTLESVGPGRVLWSLPTTGFRQTWKSARNDAMCACSIVWLSAFQAVVKQIRVVPGRLRQDLPCLVSLEMRLPRSAELQRICLRRVRCNSRSVVGDPSSLFEFCAQLVIVECQFRDTRHCDFEVLS